MDYRDLGKGGLRVSTIGLGCMGMSHAYGAPASRREMTELLADTVDMGYTFFDTAESYGTATNPHDNEELLGEALKPFRDRIVLATKFGISFEHLEAPGVHSVVTDSRPEAIRRAVEGSLRRLQTDHIDLYYQHRTDPHVEPEAVASVMADLIKEGKVLHWGLSEASVEYLRRAHGVCPVAAVQNRYSMMARWNEALFPVLEELGIGFVAFSPLANGLLSRYYTESDRFDAANDYRASMPQFQKESFAQNEALFILLDGLAEQKHATPAPRHPQAVPVEGEYRGGRRATVRRRDKANRHRPRHDAHERRVQRFTCKKQRSMKPTKQIEAMKKYFVYLVMALSFPSVRKFPCVRMSVRAAWQGCFPFYFPFYC